MSGSSNMASQEEMKPERKGKVLQASDKEVLLVNTNGQTFKVAATVFLIWDLCDGSQTLADIAQHLADQIGADPSTLKPQLLELTQFLERADLLKFL